MTLVEENSNRNGVIKTFNRMGYTTLEPDAYGQAFIDFVKGMEIPVLDIGAAVGVITIPALLNGATVIANDISSEHLETLQCKTPPHVRSRLKIKLGSFPDDLTFKNGSLGAVIASRVFHFIPPEKLIEGLKKIYHWLLPGGRLFAVCSTPFASIFRDFIPLYEKRVALKEKWPGYIENIFEYVDEKIHAVPRVMNLFDDRLLSQIFADAGFIVEKLEYIPDKQEDSPYKLDGREMLGIIGCRKG